MFDQNENFSMSTSMSTSTSIEGKNIRVHGGGGSNNFLCFKRSPYDGQYGLGTCPDKDLQPTLRFERDPFSGKYFLVDANRGGIYAWQFAGHEYPNRVVYTTDRKSTFPEQFLWEKPVANLENGTFVWKAWNGNSPSQYTMNQGLSPILPSTRFDTRTENPWYFKFAPPSSTAAAGASSRTRRNLPRGSVLITIPLC